MRKAPVAAPRPAHDRSTSPRGDAEIRVVAIDGPAGAGKSTLARSLAEHLGVERLDTGAMYRAVAWSALRHRIDVSDAEAVARLARDTAIEVGERVVVDGEDATAAIRSAAVDSAVSAVAANPAVRAELVARQRAWVAERGRGVVEGRDIGSVVLPDADLKVYLTAATETRARRRARERAEGRSVDAVHDDLVRRDRLDSTRLASPLPSPEDVAADAKVIDSTGKSSRAVFEEVLACL
ncbi:MAG TPA: (d)CMP kinase [Acidimicrobiales bacterium]|nr:(d)CMP kinase [Acidimicrobiales bacterium]